jgi:hypothetical protein
MMMMTAEARAAPSKEAHAAISLPVEKNARTVTTVHNSFIVCTSTYNDTKMTYVHNFCKFSQRSSLFLLRSTYSISSQSDHA